MQLQELHYSSHVSRISLAPPSKTGASFYRRVGIRETQGSCKMFRIATKPHSLNVPQPRYNVTHIRLAPRAISKVNKRTAVGPISSSFRGFCSFCLLLHSRAQTLQKTPNHSLSVPHPIISKETNCTVALHECNFA